MPPLRVMFDARMSYHGGIGTYVRSLIDSLVTSGGLDHLCVLGAPQKTVPPNLPTSCQQPYRAPIYSVAEQLRLPRNIHHAALWHAPHFNIPLRWDRAKPLVVTVHDLIHLKRPRDTRNGWASYGYACFMLNQVARRARAVIVPSEATKRDLCASTGIDAARITVIPHGPPIASTYPTDDIMTKKILERYGVRPPFVLWVSAIRPHKNPLMALRAFARLKAQHPEMPHRLVMIGRCPPWYQEPLREAQHLGLHNIVQWVDEVRPGELPAFYQSAQVLMMPSYEEGFGFPVLEAMTFGLPVLVSSAGSLPELVGEAGVVVAPDDVDGWAQHLYNVLFHEDVRRTLQTRGRQRAQAFTWERSVAQHLDVYRAALR